MRRLLRSGVSGAVLVSALASGPAAVASVGGSGRLVTPAVEDCGQGAPLVRPSSMILTCADDGEVAGHLHWTSWSGKGASATGIVAWRECANRCVDSMRWDSTSADYILTDPVHVGRRGTVFTRLELRVTGRTPRGFLRDLAFSEAPAPASTRSPRAGVGRVALPSRAPSGSLSYAAIEGYWIYAGGPDGTSGGYTDAQIAAAITGAESSFLPGIIQPGVDYCGPGADRAGWGLWQITCGNSVPQYGTDFQILDPWNNAEEAVYKCVQDMNAGDNCFDPWSTYTDGAYAGYLQHTNPNMSISDPGEYVQVNSTPPGTPSAPAPDPGSTYGPPMPNSATPESALQVNTTDLWTLGALGDQNWGAGMAKGTSPSIAKLAGGGYEVAIQTNTNDLWTLGAAGDKDWKTGMMPGTSPSITALPGGGYEVALQVNTGAMWTLGNAGDKNWGAGMAKGTSPSIAALPSGGYEVALQTNTNDLWTLGNAGDKDWKTGMMAGTSPSIAALPGSGYEVALQVNTGAMWTLGNAGDKNWNAGMAKGTSPSIAALPSGGYEVALQVNTGSLWTLGNAGDKNWNAGMMAGTSPSIAALSGGGYEVALQVNTGSLWWLGDAGDKNWNAGMAPGTSPSITA